MKVNPQTKRPDLEFFMGKIVDYVHSPDSFVNATKALVVGASPGVGITLVNADNHNEYLYCLHGPLQNKRYRKAYETGHISLDLYEALQDAAWSMLTDGKFIAKVTDDIYEKAKGRRRQFGEGPSSRNCAFNQ